MLYVSGTPHKPNPRDSAGFARTEAADNARWLTRRAVPPVPPEDVLEEGFSLDTIGNAYFLRVGHTDPAGHVFCNHPPRSRRRHDGRLH